MQYVIIYIYKQYKRTSYVIKSYYTVLTQLFQLNIFIMTAAVKNVNWAGDP